MTKKQLFIDYVTNLMKCDTEDILNNSYDEEKRKAIISYFEALKMTNDGATEKPILTDNGKLILKYIQESDKNGNNMLKAKDIAEAIAVSSRQVSGAMRKLVNDGYVEKVGKDPIMYSITEKGKNVEFEGEN